MTRFIFPDLFNEFNEICSNWVAPNYSEKCGELGITVAEDEKEFMMGIPLPGIEPEDVELTIDQKRGKILIRAVAKDARENVKYHSQCKQNFAYEIPLPDCIDPNEKVNAVCKHGILNISFLKAKTAEPMKIQVKLA
ncbi:MAG: Hsp20/alpha crystallin family protein [Chlamydiae bacterium]|nr:Hsp20/alpha crystallin family protein [Chlamydiota bacterium]